MAKLVLIYVVSLKVAEHIDKGGFTLYPSYSGQSFMRESPVSDVCWVEQIETPS